jgi:F-type H+-transporting ATPase subunit b
MSPGTLETIGFSVTTWVVNIVGFLLLFAVLSKYLWPRLSEAVETRRGRLAREQAEAEEKLASAGVALEQARAKAVEMAKQAEDRAEAAIRDASGEADKIRNGARDEAAAMKRQARVDAERMGEAALEDAKRQAAQTAGAMAGQLLANVLDAERQKALLDAAVADVEALVGKEERN